MSQKVRLLVLCGSVLLTGCDVNSKLSSAAGPSHNFTVAQGAQGAFLVDSTTGKVWQLDTQQNAFIEVPVTSKIIEYVRDKDGRIVRGDMTGDDSAHRRQAQEGDTKTNGSGDHVVFHDGKWQLNEAAH